MSKRPGRPRSGGLDHPKVTRPWLLTRTTRSGAYFAIPEQVQILLPWLKHDSESAVDLLFWLDEPGRAQVLPALDFVMERNEAIDSGDKTFAHDVWLTVHHGVLMAKSPNLRIPMEVVIHVSGDPTESTPFWVWIGEGARMELWGEPFRQKRISEANQRLRRESEFFGTAAF